MVPGIGRAIIGVAGEAAANSGFSRGRRRAESAGGAKLGVSLFFEFFGDSSSVELGGNREPLGSSSSWRDSSSARTLTFTQVRLSLFSCSTDLAICTFKNSWCFQIFSSSIFFASAGKSIATIGAGTAGGGGGRGSRNDGVSIGVGDALC